MEDIFFKINGIEYNAPIEWKDIQVLATFDKGSVQANISTETFTFVNEAAQVIKQHITDGLNGSGVGIFEGIPIEIVISDASNTFTSFNGFIDLVKGFKEISPVKVEVAITDLQGFNQLDDLAEANSYGFLRDQNIITDADFVGVNYVVEKQVYFIELVMAGIVLYALNKELSESIRRIVERIAQGVGVSGAGLTGAISAIIMFVIALLAEAAYAAIIIVQIVKLTLDLINRLISPIRTHNTMYLGVLLKKAIEDFGYGFEHNIPELDQVVYLPSSPVDGGEITEGVPKAKDFGYRVSEMLTLVKRIGNARTSIVDNVVQLRTKSDPYWIQNSTYVIPDILPILEKKEYNTKDLIANRLIAFQTDPSDQWTIQNFTGTNVEVITTPITVTDKRKVLIKGLEEVQIPCALGNRKQGLNELEQVLRDMASVADSLINFFGGNSNLAAKITERVGMLMVSENNHNVAKLLYVNSSGSLPSNHREVWSAKILEDNYHFEKSFIKNGFKAQKRIFEGEKVPFGFTQYLALINSNMGQTFTGIPAEINKISWTFGGAFAELDFKIDEKYTENIQETTIEG